MNDDTEFEFEIGPTTPVGNVPPVNAPGTPPSVSGAALPTHHFHTSSGTVTVAAHDVRAALIAALSDAHRSLEE